ncbi:hypothetical protein E1180_06680 [Roseibium denhamense]|uniref:Uncharacterized protein n=1 Tax=Roseibium denhamense TaxID=76305 RepID=A0ABY1P792_9HYPH|nr:hypothetical protein [Roseibium denhamense]MTI05197.1 hypothetical protein [Roseibium denhamense]SMP25787.1 hypothetical protein SAMN06265374_2607 [Roseibium denhamense]
MQILFFLAAAALKIGSIAVLFLVCLMPAASAHVHDACPGLIDRNGSMNVQMLPHQALPATPHNLCAVTPIPGVNVQ